MKFLTILSTSCLLTFATAGAVHAAPVTQVHYAWTIDNISYGVTTLNKDGTCSNSLTAMRCVWETNDPKGLLFTMSWGDGRVKDTLTISADGNFITGGGEHVINIRGIRQADAPPPRAGGSVDTAAIVNKSRIVAWQPRLGERQPTCTVRGRPLGAWELGTFIKDVCVAIQTARARVARLADGTFVKRSGDTCEVQENAHSDSAPLLCLNPPGSVSRLAGRSYDWAVGGIVNGIVKFNYDGSCSHSTAPINCVWFIDFPTVVVVWNDGLFKDILNLSLGGRALEGKNEQGVLIQGIFTGRRHQ